MTIGNNKCSKNQIEKLEKSLYISVLYMMQSKIFWYEQNTQCKQDTYFRKTLNKIYDNKQYLIFIKSKQTFYNKIYIPTPYAVKDLINNKAQFMAQKTLI